MPRKYRPPASSKRRKPRSVDYDFPTPPEEAGVESAVAEDGEYDDDSEFVEEPVVARAQPKSTIADRPERHVRRDYSYVRNDVIRIAILGVVLIAAIIIGGFFR